MQAQEFVEKYAVTVDFKFVGERHSKQWSDHTVWKVTLKYPGSTRYATDYHTGSMVSDPEDALSVVHSLALDANSGRDNDDLVSFMSDFGYEDSEEALRVFNACKRAERELCAWCKSEGMWEDFLSVEY